jgi:hypothetical protein
MPPVRQDMLFQEIILIFQTNAEAPPSPIVIVGIYEFLPAADRISP